MKDPFTTLGVSSTAGEEEIKAAYRRLAKQYHPDLHPGDKQAEQKMQEINEAYAEAMRVRKNGSYRPESYGDGPGYQSGGAGYGGNGSPFGNWSGQQVQWDPFDLWGFGFRPGGARYTTYTAHGYDDPELQAAADRISAGRYQEARSLLENMTGHGAAWHYLYALAAQGSGDRISAISHAQQAVQLDPGNSEYASLLAQLQGSGQQYRQAGGYRGFGSALCASPIMTCCAANMLLNCLCGRGYVMCC